MRSGRILPSRKGQPLNPISTTFATFEKPTDVDQKGDWYCFERGASKTAGGEGWADVWKRGHFGWEYKGKRKDLKAAYAQLQQYAVALENPPLLAVSDMDRIIVHTNWTNTVSEVHTIELEELKEAGKRDLLRWVFTDPQRLKPSKTIDALTREAADKFAGLAIRLHNNGHDPHQVAHFVNRLVFCMFAEDINLLRENRCGSGSAPIRINLEERRTSEGDGRAPSCALIINLK